MPTWLTHVEVTGPISALSWLLAFAFPLIPYELFAIMPFIIAYFAAQAKAKGSPPPAIPSAV